jgi:phosphohistidine phosphatase
MTRGTLDRHAYLLRHAKSSWSDPELDDHDRPLARRGVKATNVLRKHMRREGIAPQLVVCSSAVRAMQTLEGVREAFAPETRVEIEDGLYAAGADRLLARLREVPDDLDSVMVIAHNPGMEDLALALAGSGDDADLERMRTKYPTGGLATLGFDGSWRELGSGRARLNAFVMPRELKKR